jgi:glycosyltransferase involved in cell wall biosynthesis
MVGSAIGRLLLPLARGRFGFVIEAAAYSFLARALSLSGDIIVANGYSSPFVGADFLFCHGSIRGFRFAIQGRRLLYGPAEILEMVAGMLAVRAIAVSQRTAKEWHRMYMTPNQRLQVLQNCVDTEAFKPIAGTKRSINNGVIRVLFVARLGPQKGTDRLFRLIEFAGTREPRLCFVIATPDSEGISPFEGMKEVEHLIGVPFKDLPELYRSCDVLYVPSRYEGFEMVTLESLSSGTPVVGSDVGGIAELVRLGFQGVVAVDPENTEDAFSMLVRTAEAWARQGKKEELHRRVALAYSLESWGSRLAMYLDGSDG